MHKHARAHTHTHTLFLKFLCKTCGPLSSNISHSNECSCVSINLMVIWVGKETCKDVCPKEYLLTHPYWDIIKNTTCTYCDGSVNDDLYVRNEKGHPSC